MTFLGRTGTVLVAVGLALVLLSTIPPQKEYYYDFKGNAIVQPETFSIESQFYLSLPLDPQRGLQINVRASDNIIVYLLDVDTTYLCNWITSHFSEPENESLMFNISILEEFLNNHPNSVAWQGNPSNGQVEFQYVPTKLVSVTLIFLNPSSESVRVNYNGDLLSFIVPSERVLKPAKFIIPLGFVLVLAWLTSTWKRQNYHCLKTTTRCTTKVAQAWRNRVPTKI